MSQYDRTVFVVLNEDLIPIDDYVSEYETLEAARDRAREDANDTGQECFIEKRVYTYEQTFVESVIPDTTEDRLNAKMQKLADSFRSQMIKKEK